MSRAEVPQQTDDQVLNEILRRLVEAYRPERVYLFGSHARGETAPDSDYDIMVVIPHSDQPAYRRAQHAHGLLWDLGRAVDVLVWTHDAFVSREHIKASLPATIIREGKLLYAA